MAQSQAKLMHGGDHLLLLEIFEEVRFKKYELIGAEGLIYIFISGLINTVNF